MHLNPRQIDIDQEMTNIHHNNICHPRNNPQRHILDWESENIQHKLQYHKTKPKHNPNKEIYFHQLQRALCLMNKFYA